MPHPPGVHTVRPVCERDETWHLAVGGGSPSDPEPLADGPPPSDEVVQAVADFVADLVEDVEVAERS